MTYRSIHGTSPSYLQSCFTRVSDMTSRRGLRSSTSHRLTFRPLVCLQSVSGATVWNDLPLQSHLRRHSRFSDNDSITFCFPFLLRHYHVTYVLTLPFIGQWILNELDGKLDGREYGALVHLRADPRHVNWFTYSAIGTRP